jgi:hypothetical protein
MMDKVTVRVKPRQRGKSVGVMVLVAEVLLSQARVQALPPPEDIPEEVLHMDVITAARSPLSGQPLSAADYAELQDQLRQTPVEVPARLAPQLPRNVSLLRLRKVLKVFLPFLF